MAGASLSATFDLAGVERSLGRLSALARDATPMMRVLGVALAQSTRNRFPLGKDPEGKAWHPLLPAYAEIKRGPSILIGAGGMSGGLQGSITFHPRARDLVVGTNKVYGAIHQFGGTITAKNAPALRFFLGNGKGGKEEVKRQSVFIPARPYLGISAADRVEIAELVEDFLARALRG